MKRLFGKIGEALLRGILALFAALPLKVHYFNAIWLSFLVEKVVRYRRKVVWDNLTHAFPDKSEAEIKDIAHKFYRHFADVVVEAIWFGGCHTSKRLKRARVAEISDAAPLQRVYDVSPSVALMNSHSGNWELSGGLPSFNYDKPNPIREDNACSVYRRQSSAVWDRILRDNRIAPLSNKKVFDGYLESKELLRYMIKHRDEKKVYVIATDQKPYFSAKDYLKVVFMGRECNTMSAAAEVAIKLHLGVVYQRMAVRESGHGYIIDFVPVCEDAATMSVEEIMKRYFGLLEEDLRRQPFNYLWTHNRWWMG